MINDTPHEDRGADTPDDLDAWAPSIRAICLTNSYEEYLELMAQYTKELRHEL